MFDWNHNRKKDSGDNFMDFMIFNTVMNGGQKKQKSKEAEQKRDWIGKLEALDAMEGEDD